MKVTRFGCLIVQGEKGLTSASFPGPDPIPLIGQEMTATREQERPRFPFRAIHMAQKVSLQVLSEEFLGQILCVMDVVSAAPYV